ncbi:MAG: SBBP repeat-containing protein [Cryomorphaceae bacterium]|nr:SBBP repeat-containing protein [Cryomorphaceae bacterium]
MNRIFILLLFVLFSMGNAFSTGFTENTGQISSAEVLFSKSEGSFQLFLRQTGFTYQFVSVPSDNAEWYKETMRQGGLPTFDLDVYTHRVDVDFLDANPAPNIVSEKALDRRVYHSRSSVSPLRTYEQVTYKDLYPGIDLVFYEDNGRLKYDFIVHPGADPSNIALSISHHDGVAINKDGALVIETSLGQIKEQTPISFQNDKPIKTAFELEGDVLKFSLGRYRKQETLRIDPSVIWSTYVGGNVLEIPIYATHDFYGNLYTSGTTFSTDLATTGAHQTTLSASSDAYLIKYSDDGQLIWATYYGGNEATTGTGCAVDSFGNVYLTGETRATSGIATTSAHQTTLGGVGIGQGDAFLVKFDSTGARLWATYFGGADDDAATHCEVDHQNNVYITGRTNSSGTFISGGHQTGRGGDFDAFLAKFNESGAHQWSTYYGGGLLDYGHGIATNTLGDVFLSGTTASTDSISTLGVHQYAPSGGITDAFLVRFNSNGLRIWGTYFGGNSEEIGLQCAADDSGSVYMVGGTSSADDISTTNAHQEIRHGLASNNFDGFLAKFNPQGDQVWGTYYGGAFNDEIIDVFVAQSGQIFVAGYTNSPNNHPTFSVDENIATAGSHLTTFQGGIDGFIAEFSPQGQRQWGSYFGGAETDFAVVCMSNALGEVFVGGQTNSPFGIASPNAQQTLLSAVSQGFLAKIETCNTVSRPNIQSCDPVSSPSGDSIYEFSGTYYDTLINRFGCDSIIVTTLVITEVNTGVRVRDIFLEAAQSPGTNVSYEWLDCENNFAPIGSVDTRRFFPGGDGNFAVAVTVDGCTDTSACVSFRYIGTESFTEEARFKVYPNPSNGMITMETAANGYFTIVDMMGQEIKRENLNQSPMTINLKTLSAGMYVVTFVNNESGERIQTRLLIQ